MMRQILSFALGLLLGAGAAQAESLVITDAHVLAPEGDRWLTGHAIHIENGVIKAVAPRDEIQAPENSVEQSLLYYYVIPGMIDLHTHLLLRPYDEESWNDQVLKNSHELRTIRGAVGAERTLKAGFTTIRDLGTEGAAYADVALRDAIDQGVIPGPRVVVVTRAIVAAGCYGPQGFAPHVRVPLGAQPASGTDEVRRVVREQIAGGAQWLKVYADYRRGPNEQATPTFSQAELEALVDEAHSAGRPVSAHATTDEGIRRAVLAGADTIEHGYGATRPILELMRKHGAVLCPTLAASEAMALYSGWRPESEPEPARITQAKSMFAAALDVGVAIACGSDAGVFDHGDNARELELMAEYGMTPAQALRSATLDAARVLRREGELGVIAPGALADLVALGADPLEDISATRQVVIVVARGELVPIAP